MDLFLQVAEQEDAVKDKDGFDNDDGDDKDRGGTDLFHEDSDEEYVPPASPTVTTRRKGKVIADKKENGEEDRSKTGSVHCPTCKKTFRSKYYLKVHNRYALQTPLSLSIALCLSVTYRKLEGCVVSL